MPIYEYYCQEHKRFAVRQPMFDEREANCPECSKPAEPRLSTFNSRIAEPITLYQDLGRDKDGNHRGYQVQGWKADSGISPKPGEPLKAVKQVVKEEEDSINAQPKDGSIN